MATISEITIREIWPPRVHIPQSTFSVQAPYWNKPQAPGYIIIIFFNYFTRYYSASIMHCMLRSTLH
jgi:hypothetical protein